MPLGGGDTETGKITITTARYAGDWDCDRTAMANLAFQIERRTKHVLSADYNELALTAPRLFESAFVFLSGHQAFRLSARGAAALRRYLRAGGSLWVNDSTHEGDETFDAAFRREIARLLPADKLVRVAFEHALFRSCYDLSRGFRGYRMPPGDKYRVDYLEGVFLAGRLAVLYTRNDYGDGLEINEATFPLMQSLTDLSPQDMQEGSVRMGMNIAFYFLGGGEEKETTRLRNVVGAHEDERRRRGDRILAARGRPLEAIAPGAEWQAMPGWGDSFQLAPKNGAVTATIVRGKEGKNVLGRAAQADLSAFRYCLVELDNRMGAGVRLAMAFSTGDDWRYFESAPRFARPGASTAVFDLKSEDFKTEASQWRHCVRLEGLDDVRRVNILIYPIRGGAIELRGVRLVPRSDIPGE